MLSLRPLIPSIHQSLSPVQDTHQKMNEMSKAPRIIQLLFEELLFNLTVTTPSLALSERGPIQIDRRVEKCNLFTTKLPGDKFSANKSQFIWTITSALQGMEKKEKEKEKEMSAELGIKQKKNFYFSTAEIREDHEAIC
ncbi:hypothetical protein CEXT_417431 [Caerostris extrusa]|uniref:Uncharacterized protein n=1 Tax=Caerostris extrusa TaxID=172846 RepID=A0AAV4QWH2_CAEEX|nr:hypothetical protein CEXT_417431 [Caerostris extrusa]